MSKSKKGMRSHNNIRGKSSNNVKNHNIIIIRISNILLTDIGRQRIRYTKSYTKTASLSNFLRHAIHIPTIRTNAMQHVQQKHERQSELAYYLAGIPYSRDLYRRLRKTNLQIQPTSEELERPQDFSQFLTQC